MLLWSCQRWYRRILCSPWRAFSCRGKREVLETHTAVVPRPHEPSETGWPTVETLQHQLRHPLRFCPIAYSLQLGKCMDPLLCKLKQKQLGLSVNGLFLGPFAHADDIWSSAANLKDAKEQITTVDSFTKSRGLHLCPEKCALLHSSHQFISPSISVGEAWLPVDKSVKCLGVWWDSPPSPLLQKEQINLAQLSSHMDS